MGRDTTVEAIVALLKAADWIHRHMDRVCADCGITASQYNILRILAGAGPDGLTRGEVIERMIAAAPDVTRRIDRLEEQGLVRRVASTDDRRLSLARITPRGRALLDEMRPAVDAINRRFADRVAERDRAHLTHICRDLIAND